MKVLVVGNGGREHALVKKLSKSSRVTRVYVAPGNGGTETENGVENVRIESVIDFARKENIGLVVPGPELPLIEGIQDECKANGIPCFGPSKAAARLEGSKAWSKEFMRRNGIPTAKFENFADYNKALSYLNSIDHEIVIKASGLAAGKGVIIPPSKQHAREALKEIMVDRVFGDAGSEVVIEELLVGHEISVLTFSDGYSTLSLPPSEDHKRIFDGDKGPNTGGMGTYAPSPYATPAVIAEIEKKIVGPTVAAMRREKCPFVGMLFTGVMLTQDGPKTLEYNVRFGDPETQSVLSLLESDLFDLMFACTEGCLDACEMRVKDGFAVTVVAAAEGYPGSYGKGDEIEIKGSSDAVDIYHAGTAMKDGKLVTNGGRVLAVTGTGETLQQALDLVYREIDNIKFKGIQYRRDIGQKGLNCNPAITYSSTGVSVDEGNRFVEEIKEMVASTRQVGADANIGGFGGIVDLSSYGAKDLMMIAATDGVGTKLLIAQQMDRHDTVGIDLVAMNVNDLVVQGAKPVAFLDYFACGKLKASLAKDFVSGVVKGCKESDCALVGGETAEMPGMYSNEHYDVAGTAIGICERSRLLPNTASMTPGDLLIGITSSGPHSNGFSLIRGVLSQAGLDYKDNSPWNRDISVGEYLLTPTKLYVRVAQKLISSNLVKGFSHITGGGIVENVPRMLPDTLSAVFDASKWQVPEFFKWVLKSGNVPLDDMVKTLNMGIGMVVAIDPKNLDAVSAILKEFSEDGPVIGHLVPSTDGKASCKVENMQNWLS